MRRLLWLLIPLAVAAVLLAGCGGDELVKEAEGGPHTVRPSGSAEISADRASAPEIDGGFTDNSDPSAPKTIESSELISFDCWFSTLDAAEPGALGSHIYQLSAKLENGEVMGTYQVRDAGEERPFRAGPEFLVELQGLVELYDLAQFNGLSHEVAGLPGDYGARLEARYASGERIDAEDNQENFLAWGAMNELLKLFERAAAPMPELLSLAVETQSAAEVLTEGHGWVSFPSYRLDAEGYDALSAALAALNEERRDGASGEMEAFRSAGRGELYHRRPAFVTRADSVALSFYERVSRYESADWDRGMTEYEAHNLDPRTGKELGFADVFRDLDNLPGLLLTEFQKTYPEQSFYEEALDFIRSSIDWNDGNINFALGYGCVHVFANEYVLNGEAGGQHITLSFVLNPDQVRADYVTAPQRWLLPLDYDVTYCRGDISAGFRMRWTMEPEREEGTWELRIEGGEAATYEENFYGHAPECWMAHASGRDFIYLRVPVGDVSQTSYVYEVTEGSVTKLTGEALGLALRPDTPLDPDGMRMNLNEMVFSPVVMLLPWGSFRVGESGLPEPAGEVYGLDGTGVLLLESGRYNPDSRENAAVSGGMWTLMAGTLLRPYQTDMKSFLDFITEDGRVVRFEINEFSENMLLDNFGTLEKVFLPEGVG